jgi:hypothetical protein
MRFLLWETQAGGQLYLAPVLMGVCYCYVIPGAAPQILDPEMRARYEARYGKADEKGVLPDPK